MTGRRLDTLTGRLFSNGIGFFVPYVAIYLTGWAVGTDTSGIRSIFLVLHGVLASLLIVHCVRRRAGVNPASVLFWSGLTILFFLPGAYLEYPDDSWEHVRRIFSWQNTSDIGSSPFRLRFASFWMWTFLADVPIPARRAVLDVVSTFWQMLLAFQIFRFSRTLGFTTNWARIQVFGTVCLFGTNLFGFYRYHALASTPLAYCAYLSGLALLIRRFGPATFSADKTPILPCFALLPALGFSALIMWLNHLQELMLFAVACLALVIAKAWQRAELRSPLAAGFLLTAILSVLFATWNITHQELFRLATWFPWAEHATNWGDEFVWQRLFNALGRGLGLHQGLAVVAALWLTRRSPMVAWLTLTGVFMMFFPPVILATAALHGSSGEWLNERLPLVLSSSFAIIEGIRIWLGRSRPTWAPTVAVVAVVALGVLPQQPWRGKLWFQLQQSPDMLELRPLDTAVSWLKANRVDMVEAERRSKLWITDWFTASNRLGAFPTLTDPDRCLLVTDGTTAFITASQLGLLPATERRRSDWPTVVASSPETLQQQAGAHAACGFLVADPPTGLAIPGSTVAKLAGRADTGVVREDLLTPPEYRKAVAGLTRLGWTSTTVPPFYTLFEPPGRPYGSASARAIWPQHHNPTPGPFQDGFEGRDLSAWTDSSN